MVFADIIDSVKHIRLSDVNKLSNLSFPGAKPAIHGASVTDKKQYPVRVSVDKARNRGEFFLMQRIFKVYIIVKLSYIRDTLFPYCIILLLNKTQIVAADFHWIDAFNCLNILNFLSR